MKTYTVDLTLSINAMTEESADNKLDAFLSALDLKKNDKIDLVNCGDLSEGGDSEAEDPEEDDEDWDTDYDDIDWDDDEEDTKKDEPEDEPEDEPDEDPLASILSDINSDSDDPPVSDDEEEDWDDWE